MTVLFRNVEVAGRPGGDVLVRDELVAEVTPHHPASAVASAVASEAAVQVIDGRGGALLPGLHDHHLHLLATAAANASIECGTPQVRDEIALARALRSAPNTTSWVRGIGYHESVAGPLDRGRLDELVADRPVRIQHRGGALWMLNSRALEEVAAALDGSPDVELGTDGQPNGRLWRYDARLRPALPADRPDLGSLGRMLVGFGITGVTDATPELDTTTIAILADAVSGGDLPVRVQLLGAPTTPRLPAGLTIGPRKLLLRDHALPTYDELSDVVAQTHSAGRAVAVHCVTRESLVLTVAVLAAVGALVGDRIEHAAVVPTGLAAEIARLGVHVVTQPGFLRTRGDDYLREVDPRDQGCLYPYASLVAAGVLVAASSDAPYGGLDPWQTVRAASERTTLAGAQIGSAERVPAATALDGYLSAPEDPGGRARRIVPGAPADLCLLHVPVQDAVSDPDAAVVRATMIAGAVAFGA